MLNKKILHSSLLLAFLSTLSFATESVWIDNTTTDAPENSVRIGEDAVVGYDEAIAIGKSSNALGSDSIAIGRYNTSEQRGTVVGSYTYAADSATAIGVNAHANSQSSVAVGEDSSATGTGSISMGSNSIADGDGALAVGIHAEALSDDAVALGKYTTSASRGTSVGTYSSSATAATAIGINAQAQAENSVSIGTDSVSSGANSVSLGTTSSATANNSVALGYNSVADEENTVSVGSSTNQRRITNVADGINDTDVVNVRQLNYVEDEVYNVQDQVDSVQDQVTSVQNQVNTVQDQVNNVQSEARAGIASAMALAPTVLPEVGKTSLNLGVAGFQGEGATSINVNHRMIHHKTDITLGFGVSADTQQNVGVRANLGIVF